MSYHLCYQNQGKLKYFLINAVPTQNHSQFEDAIKKCENMELEGKLPKNKWCILKNYELAYAKDSKYYQDYLAVLIKPFIIPSRIEKKIEENKPLISHGAHQLTLAGLAYTFLSFIKH